MSFQETRPPNFNGRNGEIELRLASRETSLGEFTVRRVLPAAERQMVGPFIFFDHLGPTEFPPGAGIQVRPHPHIGIATVTYLFEGEIMHRDSLGYEQAIRPGAVNLMTAGKGIVHSERAGSDLHDHATLHGIQSWMALPMDCEEMEPAFEHCPASELPVLNIDDVEIRIIIGEAFGRKSPVSVYATMVYLECRIPKGKTLMIPDSWQELAAYVVDGTIGIDDEEYDGGTLAVARSGSTILLEALEDCRVMVIGGDHAGERKIWWNFVSSSAERIEQAKVDWKEGRFARVPDDDEFIPLPEYRRSR